MSEKRHLKKKNTNDVTKIILYMIFMTALFVYYCSYTNDDFVKSLDYNYSYLYDNEVIIPSSSSSSSENGNEYLYISIV